MAHLIFLFVTISLLSTSCYALTQPNDEDVADGATSIEEGRRREIDGGDTTDDATSSRDDDCGVIDQTRPCDCGNFSGRQVCERDGWSDCECDTEIERMLKECRPGRYSGFFEGYYISYLAPGVSQYITSTPTEDSSGLEFDLVEVSIGKSFEIQGGKLIGMTQTTAPVPFEADIVGTLDCTTGLLNAELANGYYEYMTLSGRFEGRMSGQYNFESHSFESGTWTVRELDQNSGLPHEENGGDGTWNATLVR